ncbi:related to alcohol dehydrogenase [Phialocephala subalpina]|uniref:Related to alcohol dehydrogenase n=1 Tax=Phialocephala subalpina TaxID=576137 RepID=A0A1L7XCM6_9HELO|nr:related to alcohol dehydrogenase [Phialocephala subalpina]
MAPTTFKQWTLEGQNGIESLVCAQARMPKELGEHEVLVKLHAASLNYRDLAIAKGAKGLVTSHNVVPGSDGAGVIVSIGNLVTPFVPGDKVVTHMTPNFAEDAFPTFTEICAGLGHTVDGTIREFGVFDQSALVHMPKNLSFEEAATLTCSGLTAWNALFGGGRTIGKGDSVLTQGTGGVSIAALQFAHATGATVISTTSSSSKASRLTTLGATHTINYRTNPSWGDTAKSLTKNHLGVSNIIDVGGLSTLPESLKAVRVEGVVTVTGVLGKEAKETPSLMDTLWRVCSVRGILLGSKRQFGDMVRFVEEMDVRPVVDERVFGIDEVREAYTWIEEQKHFSKVVIKMA